ncbi:MAG: glycosyltransferase [bacterium]|nr:glycosyltransferase [bacterium]
MTLLLIISIFIVLIYCFFIGYIITHIKLNFSKSESPIAKVSILIPCRNEAKNIANCLRSIAWQTLPINQYDIIIIDDFSEDDTVKIATEFKNKLPLTILHNSMPGKKNALALGINHAVNDCIITTDADCTMEKDWLKSMLYSFENRNLKMLCGPVNLKSDGSFFQNLQQTESAAIVGISATMLNIRKPATCNGANLMFSRAAFKELNGYGNHQQLASGDDDLLLHTFYRQDATRVGYELNYNAMVYPAACKNFAEFLNQRSRWLSKRKFYAYPWNSRLQGLIVIQLLTFYSLLIIALSTGHLLAIALILNKYLFDLMLGVKLKRVFNFKYLQILLMPFYEFYIVIVLVYARFSKIKWKGRGV